MGEPYISLISGFVGAIVGATASLAAILFQGRQWLRQQAWSNRERHYMDLLSSLSNPFDKDPGMTVDSANEERIVYLISDADGDSGETVERWIKQNYQVLFEEELEGWYTDPDLWPKKRSLKLFREWFDIECQSVLIDTVGEPMRDDDNI